MRFKVTEVVRGATRMEFKNDAGETIKAGSVFIDVSLDREGQGFGFRTDAKKCVDLGVIDRIKHTPFPFTAEIEFEERATGKNTQLMVIDVKPLKRADGGPLNVPAPKAA